MALPRRWFGALADRFGRWLSISRLLPRAGKLVVACSVLVNLLIGLLPLGFVVGISVMIGRVPAFARHQAGVWPSVLAAFGLAIGALVLQGIVSPLQVALGELISRRVDGFLARRLMAVSLERAPMAVLEQPEVLDGLNDARTRLVVGRHHDDRDVAVAALARPQRGHRDDALAHGDGGVFLRRCGPPPAGYFRIRWCQAHAGHTSTS